MRTCDLHTHSTASDGSMSPRQLAAAAARAGLGAVALTDHNTTKGLAEFSDATKRAGVIGVCGCEFTTEYDGDELHLLGLFLPEDRWPEVEAYVETRNEAKRESNRVCLERLVADGHRVSCDMLNERFPDVGTPNRANIATLLMEAGSVSSVREAFDTLLAEGAGYYEPAKKLPFLETVTAIRSWGAVPVWAHPLGLPGLPREGVARLLPVAVEHGLMGVEAYYTSYTPEEEGFMCALCEKSGIVASGGSDFHGDVKPEISLGTGDGGLCVPFSVYEELACRLRESA